MEGGGRKEGRVGVGERSKEGESERRKRWV